ncbi:hypothetical protein AKN87_02675 [Thiopseudomonas alkaliphila]|uniref:sensor histidine kinase n=1 Tax=Thiopseudomonas alkaliphila TaxID=1697053 RepID=UPI00069F4152|nr:HAMP domain-containing sensor histidine kinase [Thiopseudomonas alkaliphila]AKX44129.1 hypothetical protein AKN87_02675 [Thiopseudomonas alkaliphila]AKX46363.1 hypothetical protein AKN94_02530 [Thiopseudomonas alkaliphila]AKX49434.1 hypothetical protein AKN93_08510 [Thiopseudomonas alkaliphila]AKX50187.1 hypothetical protein AKN92_00765 [Thiopseudomonas alkaliphila]AKX52657.1 hypothetical protein AKN91_02455 [Thiopseudomonas alkaliphila]
MPTFFHSLFWRVFAALWLALILVVGATFLLAQFFNQDYWLLNHHPALQQFPEQWQQAEASNDPKATARLLKEVRKQHSIYIQVFDINEDHEQLVSRSPELAKHHDKRLAHGSGPRWRRVTQEVHTPTGQELLFVYRIAQQELQRWQLNHWLKISSYLAVTLLLLLVISLLLSLSITRPIQRLRLAVQDLANTNFKQQSLMILSQRQDELGMLARDFKRMGTDLQHLLDRQQQLLRDVSHELRSPLARLKLLLALTERSTPTQLPTQVQRMELECDRLDQLISEILDLARLDDHSHSWQWLSLDDFFEQLISPYQGLVSEKTIKLQGPKGLSVQVQAAAFERALDNLLRNAWRFAQHQVQISWQLVEQQLCITICDDGPGVAEEHLAKLSEPFYRVAGQNAAEGYGLGLTIVQRVIEQHQGQLCFSNLPMGFQVKVNLPLRRVSCL